MVLKIYKFCHSCIALSFYATVLECGTPLHSKMPRNRKRECPACFKQVRSDVLKTHCRIKHGMSDDQIDALKNYSSNIVRNISVEVSIVVTMSYTVNQESLVM